MEEARGMRSCPPQFGKSSGSIACHILQQLCKMNIVDRDPKGGRRITSSGQRDLDQEESHPVDPIQSHWIH